MAFTPPPTPPNSGDPANFNARADAFLGWMSIFAGELNAELPFISSKSWATYGGSANAINLTAGFVSLVAGMQIRFRATAANTGAATINLDGLGARPCRTITGAVVPAGYIRVGVDTIATYDGAAWVVDRQIEVGTNGNGVYVRLADGTQFCWFTTPTLTAVEVTGPLFASGAYAWAYPAAFAGLPSVSITVRRETGPHGHFGTISSGSFGAFGCSCMLVATTSGATGTLHLAATGRWY